MALGVSACGSSSQSINLPTTEASTLFRKPYAVPKPNAIQRPTNSHMPMPSPFQPSRKRNLSTYLNATLAFKQQANQFKTAEKQKLSQINSPLTELRPFSYKNNTENVGSPVVSKQELPQKVESQSDSSPFKVPSGLPPKRNVKPTVSRNFDAKAIHLLRKNKKSNSHINRVDAHHAKTSRRPKLTPTNVVPGSLQTQRRCPGYDMFLLPEPKNDTLFDVLFSMNNNMNAVKRNFSAWLTGELQYLVPQSTFLNELRSVPDNVLEWTVANVSSFVNAVGFSEAAEYLEENRVDGAGLLLLKQCDLMDVLGLQPLPAAHLFGFILRLHGDITKVLGVNQPTSKQSISAINSNNQRKCISTHLKELQIDTSSLSFTTDKTQADTTNAM